MQYDHINTLILIFGYLSNSRPPSYQSPRRETDSSTTVYV